MSLWANGVEPSRGLATGSQALYFGFVLQGCQSMSEEDGLFSTHVEYGRYAALLAVMLILGSLGSHGRSPTAMILSSTGGLSTR